MKNAALVSLVAALVAVFLLYGCEQRKAGALGARVEELTRDRDALERASKVVRTQLVHDTVRMTQTVTRYRTLRDSVFATDTLLARDTVFLRVVAAADTTIRACQESVRSCTVALSIADSIHAADQRLLRAYARSQPGTLRRWGDRLVWAAVGYAAHAVTHP